MNLTTSHGLAKELLSKDDHFLTVTIGNREYIVRGVKRVPTCANLDDSLLHMTLVVEENSGCIVR